MAMGGVFDSLGLSLAFAGAGILLAGLLLTPMRSIDLNSLRSRRSQEVEVPLPPAAAPPAPPQPAAVVQAAAPRPAVPARASEAIAVAREQDALFARALAVRIERQAVRQGTVNHSPMNGRYAPFGLQAKPKLVACFVVTPQ